MLRAARPPRRARPRPGPGSPWLGPRATARARGVGVDDPRPPSLVPGRGRAATDPAPHRVSGQAGLADDGAGAVPCGPRARPPTGRGRRAPPVARAGGPAPWWAASASAAAAAAAAGVISPITARAAVARAPRWRSTTRRTASEAPARGCHRSASCTAPGARRARAGRTGSRPVSCGRRGLPERRSSRQIGGSAGRRVGAAIREGVHDAAALEVAHDRAPAMAPAPRPVIDPHDAQPGAGVDAIPCTAVLFVAIPAPDQAPERVAARGEAEAIRWSEAGGAARGEPDMAPRIAQPVGAPPVAPRDPDEALDEDATRAARRRASEPPGPHPDHDAPPPPGQVVPEPACGGRGRAARACRTPGGSRARRGDGPGSSVPRARCGRPGPPGQQECAAEGACTSPARGSPPPPSRPTTKSAEEPRLGCRGCSRRVAPDPLGCPRRSGRACP